MYKFNKEHEILPIPCIQGYSVDKKGSITNSENYSISIEEFNADTGLSIQDPLVLTLIAFQGFKWSFAYWRYLVVKKPENSANIENMVLGIEHPVEDLANPGFYLIPYFSNYVVNKRGHILNVPRKTFVQSSKTNNGYWSARLKSDGDRVSNRLTHRIIAMAFLEYPYNFQILEVNHLNGDTLDDSYINLEWTDKFSNLAHAKMNELFKKRNPHRTSSTSGSNVIIANLIENLDTEIKLRDVTNGQLYIFNNIAQASQLLGLGIRGIKYALDANDGRVIKGYQVKYQNDFSDWSEPVYSRARNYEVTLENGQTVICSTEEAAKYCGVTRSSLQRLIREGRNKGTTNVLVKRIGTGNVLC